jgi:hypothetical protein
MITSSGSWLMFARMSSVVALHVGHRDALKLSTTRFPSCVAVATFSSLYVSYGCNVLAIAFSCVGSSCVGSVSVSVSSTSLSSMTSIVSSSTTTTGSTTTGSSLVSVLLNSARRSSNLKTPLTFFSWSRNLTV